MTTPAPTPDRHVRHGRADYAAAKAALLPQGYAWPREPQSFLMRFVAGLAGIWGGTVDPRMADLLEQETDPRIALEMLPDWERNWGLPDDCFFFDGGDIGGRHKTLMRKMTIEGGQSRAFFTEVAQDLGYTVVIHEYSPFMVGISQVGGVLDDQGHPRWEIGPPENRFYWSIRAGSISLTWFRVTVGQAAIDPHLRIGVPSDLDCLLNRWKPAHTMIVLDFTGSQTNDPMAGTP